MGCIVVLSLNQPFVMKKYSEEELQQLIERVEALGGYL